jgi:hypothetical protein
LVLTVVFTLASGFYLAEAVRKRKPGEVLHALMCLGMVAMAWTAGHHSLGALGQLLAVAFFLGAVWAAVLRAPAGCLMALGMALVFTPLGP